MAKSGQCVSNYTARYVSREYVCVISVQKINTFQCNTVFNFRMPYTKALM